MRETTRNTGDGYFLYHSIGQYPGKSEDLIAAQSRFSDVWSEPDDKQWEFLLGQRAEFIGLWSNLLGATPSTVTTCENVTQGVHMFISSLPAHMLKGKKVLVAEDCFPSNHFLLSELQKRLGFSLETVPVRQGGFWVDDDDFIKHWTEDVALALITWVSSTTSNRVDLERLVQHGREMGSLIGVDITQAAGLLPFDVNSPPIDFAVSTSLKWMCGTPGAGVLYVDQHLIQTCSPEVRGWFSQPDPFNWSLDRFELANDIRRFDNGTPSIVSALSSVPALKWHAQIDMQENLAHNRRLSTPIIDAVDQSGAALITPRDPERRGGSVMINLSDPTQANLFLDKLSAQEIYADRRDTIVRLSPGVMTSMAAAEELANLIANEA